MEKNSWHSYPNVSGTCDYQYSASFNCVYVTWNEVYFVCQLSGWVRAQQADINERMRAILVDWLVEVHLKFKVFSLILRIQYQWICVPGGLMHLQRRCELKMVLKLYGCAELVLPV